MPAARMLADDRRDEIEELPAAQRVGGEGRVVRRPQRRRGEAQLLRHLAEGQHRAVAHVARDGRLGIADDLLADHRAPAVRADQGGSRNAFAVLYLDSYLRSFLMKTRDLGARPQFDQVARPAAVEQRAVDIGAVRHRVRVAEAPGEALVERHVDDLLAAHAVEHEQAFDEDRVALHALADAERVDRVPGVGRELDAGADLAELARLLEHQDAEVPARERERDGEPAEAAAEPAAGHYHRLRVARRHRRYAATAPTASTPDQAPDSIRLSAVCLISAATAAAAAERR